MVRCVLNHGRPFPVDLSRINPRTVAARVMAVVEDRPALQAQYHAEQMRADAAESGRKEAVAAAAATASDSTAQKLIAARQLDRKVYRSFLTSMSEETSIIPARVDDRKRRLLHFTSDPELQMKQHVMVRDWPTSVG